MGLTDVKGRSGHTFRGHNLLPGREEQRAAEGVDRALFEGSAALKVTCSCHIAGPSLALSLAETSLGDAATGVVSLRHVCTSPGGDPKLLPCVA